MSFDRPTQQVIPGLLLQNDPLVRQIQTILNQTDLRNPAQREQSDRIVRGLIQKRMAYLGDAYYTIWQDSLIVNMNDLDG